MIKSKEIPEQMGIYMIICEPSGKIYVGSSTNIRNRWWKHKTALNRNDHDNSYLQHAWNKYGEEAFILQIIQPVINLENLVPIEEGWIRLKNACNRDVGFNQAELGSGYSFLGKKHTDETKAILRRKKLGKKLSLETCEKKRVAMSGRTRPPEVHQKMWETRRRMGKGKQPKVVDKLGHPVTGYNESGEKVFQFKSLLEARRNGFSSVPMALKRTDKMAKGIRWERTIIDKEGESK